jgi:hypothetical protein
VEDGMTLYFCTDEGQHNRTRLGRFTPEHVDQLDASRAIGGWFLADMRDHQPVTNSVDRLKQMFNLSDEDAAEYADLKAQALHPRRRSAAGRDGKTPDQPKDLPADTGRLVFRNGHGVGILKCPRCSRDKRISEERLREALTVGLIEVDISCI